MAKKNLPHIPLYIGDWEKDCNVLSLEAEAAWLRIIFKMFTNGKQNSYKTPTKGLQIIWKCSTEKVQEIIQELMDYNICEINSFDRFTEFTCRRFVKENNLSKKRQEAVSKRKDRFFVDKSNIQIINKSSTKHIQNTDNDIDIDNDINIDNIEGGAGGNKETDAERIDRLVKAEAICNFFNTGELKNFQVYSKVAKLLFDEGDNVYDQFEAYKSYKTQTKEKTHSILSWIADGWNICDWGEKLKSLNQEKVNGEINWDAVR